MKRHVIQKCPICFKTLESIGFFQIGNEKLTQYKCGHSFATNKVELSDTLQFDALGASGFTAREYQKDGIRFILESNFNCIIGDQMRLGKTPQALLALRNAYKTRTPCLIIVRAANIWQWIREYKVWADSNPLGIWPIQGTKSFIPPGFKTYIISMDTIGRGDILARLGEIDFKLIIADEAHSFKNDESKRSKALVEFITEKNTIDASRTLFFKCPMCKNEWEEIDNYKIVNGIEQANYYSRATTCKNCSARVGVTKESEVSTKRNCGIILLTGTAIKNRADEYYIPLNLVAPQDFPSRERFRRRYLVQDTKGQWTRVSPYAMESFKSAIKPYVLRREKEDVYTDLPPINRMFTLIEPDKTTLGEQYNKILDKIDAKMAKRANPSYWDMAEDLMALRKICGLMKIMWTADYVEASLFDKETSSNGRIAVGIHHKDVREILKFKLSHIGALTLSGEDSPETKDYVMRHFQASPEPVLILNMLAGGVGMDFHYCHNVIILERQWSFADEQQFEFRFYNPDKAIMGSNSTNIEYIIAKGTLDEWWYNMVEGKKQVMCETIGTHWDFKNQPKFFKDLLEETISHRL